MSYARRTPWMLTGATLALASSCGDDGNKTGLVVEVLSEYQAPTEIDRLHVMVAGAGTDAAPAFERDFGLGAGEARVELPQRLGIVPDGDGASGVRIELTAYLGEAPVVWARARLGFVRGQVLRLTMALLRVCRAQKCGDDTTCDARGACAPALVDETKLPPYSSDQPFSPLPTDAGGDAASGMDGNAASGSDARADGDGRAPSADASAPDLPPDMAPACDPVVAASCGAGATCLVSCTGDVAAARCAATSGKQTAGMGCATDADCAPGTQCVTYGCGARACHRLRKIDGDCGTGGSCAVDVSCAGKPSAWKACAVRGCDPRGGMPACPAGLRCYVQTDESSTCACPDPARKGGEGDDCADTRACQAGFTCAQQGTYRLCRPVCRLDDQSLTQCPDLRSCTKLMNVAWNTYGACLAHP